MREIVRQKQRKTSLSSTGTKIIIYTILGLAAVTTIFPYLWMVLASLKTGIEISTYPEQIFPKNPSFTAYRDQKYARTRRLCGAFSACRFGNGGVFVCKARASRQAGIAACPSQQHDGTVCGVDAAAVSDLAVAGICGDALAADYSKFFRRGVDDVFLYPIYARRSHRFI